MAVERFLRVPYILLRYIYWGSGLLGTLVLYFPARKPTDMIYIQEVFQRSSGLEAIGYLSRLPMFDCGGGAGPDLK